MFRSPECLLPHGSARSTLGVDCETGGPPEHRNTAFRNLPTPPEILRSHLESQGTGDHVRIVVKIAEPEVNGILIRYEWNKTQEAVDSSFQCSRMRVWKPLLAIACVEDRCPFTVAKDQA